MVQRICPVCDNTMKSAHYCSYCHKRVKNPYIRDVSYNLNGSDRYSDEQAGNLSKQRQVQDEVKEKSPMSQNKPVTLEKSLKTMTTVMGNTGRAAGRGQKNPSGILMVVGIIIIIKIFKNILGIILSIF